MATVQRPPGLGNGETEISGAHGTNNETGSTQIAYENLWKLRKYLVLLGTLAISVTYNSGLTPPGGFWYKNKDGHKAGDPALHVEFSQRYEVFFYCNATAFAASLVLIILLLSKSVTRQELWLRSMQFTMLVDLFSLMGAYAAGSCRALKSSIYTLVLVFAVFVYVWIHILVSTRFVPETFKEKVKTVVNRTLSKLGICDVETSRHQDKRDLEEARKFILMLVTFAATVTYQAGLSPPGGFWAENDYFSGSSPPYKHRPATPALRDHYLHRYKVFVSCNSTSFVASLVTIILLLSPGFSEHGKRSKAVVFCAVADLLCLIGAYAAGCCRDIRPSVYVMLIIIFVLIFIAFLAWIFVYESVADWLQKIKDEFVSCINKVDRVLSQTSNAGQQSTAASHHQNSVHTTGVPPEDQTVHDNQSEEHLKKTRTCLLLLAILAVSLTYQSGLNPPGGFWSTSENKHSAGDRILEDNNHSRFIAFFYLNAVAFVASFVMILIILSKSISEKVTKRRELQIAMIVDLLSLTGAFVMGSCREAKKSIYISVLVCLVLAYVGFHVLISIPVIPIQCKSLVSEKLKHFWSILPQICNKQTGNSTGENELDQKELERRSNLLLTLAIVAATVTYQAGINPPGGVWSDDRDVSGSPGNPILQDNRPGRYDVFYYSNSVSFVSSVVITILLVNKKPFEHGIKSSALRLCLMVGLLGLLIAYAAGSCRNKIQSIFLIIISVAVLVSVVIQALLPSMHDTLGRPLDSLIGFLHTWVFLTETVEQEVISNTPETLNCDEKMEKKRHKYLMLIAILAASITYQAGLNPPGGFWSDDNGHVAGNPLLHDINNRRYMTFFYFNSISFMASIVVIMLLLSSSVRKKYGPFEVLLCLVMILDLLALMIAFAAGSCRKFRTSVYVLLLIAGVVIFLVFIRFFISAIAKCLKKWKRSKSSRSGHPDQIS
ncbi:unnamed protein product [Urochloa decumbens]|uniref:PGG domain-containing protein n=1 Tax=Urochloa decumbens TaxID=240449 RepID=A0ABC9E8M3_9POAL